MVDHGHLELILKIRSGTQSFDDHAASLPAGILSQQFRGTVHFHIGNVRSYAADQFYPLFPGEHRLLSGVDHDTHDQFVKNIGGATNDVQMAAGNRVKTARINGNSQSNSHLNLYGKA